MDGKKLKFGYVIANKKEFNASKQAIGLSSRHRQNSCV